MIHHVSVGTNDVGRARRFYDAVLPILGILPMRHADTGLDYGSGQFLFSVETPVDGRPATVGNGSHVAFAAGRRAMVDQFHAAALAHGGTSDGAPGLRPEYDPNYYGAFVRDPDGNKIEAVTYAAK
ncbi:VOC family protein [Plastoroseomonas hellenica]|uniref:VOC family protein n=1 Tax=Plastoroseomonas hellenica TaxID=2687306 RepID=UPI001BA8F893|nr:VOC family protein [Plastoroseomonas hellenica]MBR0647145.1 VOC family protein [Plastoroseomonas hellenica]